MRRKNIFAPNCSWSPGELCQPAWMTLQALQAPGGLGSFGGWHAQMGEPKYHTAPRALPGFGCQVSPAGSSHLDHQSADLKNVKELFLKS